VRGLADEGSPARGTLSHLRKRHRHGAAFVRRQGRLRRQRVADLIALQFEAALMQAARLKRRTPR